MMSLHLSQNGDFAATSNIISQDASILRPDNTLMSARDDKEKSQINNALFTSQDQTNVTS